MSFIKRTVDEPALNWTRPRRARALLAVAYLALASGVVGAFYMLGETRNDWWIAAVAALSMPMIFVIGSLNASIRGLTELRDRHLDEMQRARRDAAYRRAYTPAIYLAGGAAAVLTFADLSLGAQLALLMGAWLALLALPVLLLSLTMPEEPRD